MNCRSSQWINLLLAALMMIIAGQQAWCQDEKFSSELDTLSLEFIRVAFNKTQLKMKERFFEPYI